MSEYTPLLKSPGSMLVCVQSHGETDTTRRLKNINPATRALNGSRKIKRAPFQKVLPLIWPDNPSGHFDQVLGGNRLARRPQGTANAQRRGQACFQMQITGALFLGRADESFQIHGGSSDDSATTP